MQSGSMALGPFISYVKSPETEQQLSHINILLLLDVQFIAGTYYVLSLLHNFHRSTQYAG